MFLPGEESLGLDREAFDGVFAGVEGAAFFAEELFFAGFLGFPLGLRGFIRAAMKAFPLGVSVRPTP